MLGHASQVGLHDHERFLRAYPPYGTLDAADLQALVASLQVRFLPRGASADVTGGVFIVRRGELDLGGEHYGPGDTLGGGVRTGTAQATTDSWLYVLPPEQAERWLSHPALHEFLTSELSARLRAADAGLDLESFVVHDLMVPPQLVAPDATVQQAAARMRDERVSSVMVPLEGSFGILTDKDLRNRVLADGLPPTTPVREVMSAPALTAPENVTALSALNLMFRHNIRHLPLMRGPQLVGMVGTAQLLRLQTRGVGFLVQDLLDAPDEDALVARAHGIQEHAAQMRISGQRAEQIARISSYAYDALYRRAIALAEGALGPPPGPYAWVLLGSIARRESGLNPDQDHQLLIEHETHRPYFEALAQRVETLLERAGLPGCSGGVMASRHLLTREAYAAQMRQWFRIPDPQALLNVTIFFDPRVVAGDLDVREARNVRLSARQHPLFLAHLTRLAASHRPPLGFRQRIRAGPGDTLDLKTQGLALIVDLARLQALSTGEAGASTFVRLREPGQDRLLHPDTCADLRAAYSYLMDLRLELQVAQLSAGQALSQRLPLHSLSGPQEVHLREVFKLIARVHATLAAQVGGP